MADITITIPDTKLPLVKAWVESRLTPDTYLGWLDADYANYVKTYMTQRLQADVETYQRNEYLKTFLFDDPLIP